MRSRERAVRTDRTEQPGEGRTEDDDEMTTRTDGADAGPLVKSADRALAVLEHLATVHAPQGLAALHQALGIPKSSLHGLLRTLRSRGWIETDATGTLFGLGVRALLVGTSYIDSDRVVAGTRDILDRLAAETGETVHLARLDGAEVVYLATRQSVHHLRMYSRVGRRLPAHATSLGKSLLAERNERQLAELLPSPLHALTAHTLTDLDELREELDRTRARGYAVDREENTLGIGCFAMALPTAVPAEDAISISVPLARLDDERAARFVQLLQEAIDELDERSFLSSG